ncbi:hypothetical protein M2351_004122 [Azospirillum canadense]|nr:hypothetical protein [Azospirillum canadense]
MPVAVIAAELGRHRSTIHREIRRNFYHDPFRDRWGQEYRGYSDPLPITHGIEACRMLAYLTHTSRPFADPDCAQCTDRPIHKIRLSTPRVPP